MQQKLMNVRVRCLTADSIYANNANRKFCTEYGISTSFVRKERAVRDESLRKVLRSELSRERATRLEGSFGTQKQHYSLSRIKARNRKTEILWLFFEIHTANAVLMIVFVHHNVFADKRYFLAINREEFSMYGELLSGRRNRYLELHSSVRWQVYVPDCPLS